jgi:threonyl-tRNA synthetase
MLVIGEKEVESQTVAVRRRAQGDLGAKPLSEVIVEIKEEIRLKK